MLLKFGHHKKVYVVSRERGLSWYRRHLPGFVRGLYVYGDGHHDGAAFNEAIEFLPSNPGGEIQVLEGTYKIDASINMNKRYVELSGQGVGGGWAGVPAYKGPVILEWTNVALGTILVVDNTSHIQGIKVSGLCFDCADVGRAMIIRSCIKSVFEDILITDVPTAAGQAILVEANGLAHSHGLEFRRITGVNPVDGTTPNLIELNPGATGLTKCTFHSIERVGDWNSAIKLGHGPQTCYFEWISAVGSLVGDVVVVDAGAGNKLTVYDNVFEHVISDNPILGISLANCVRQTFKYAGYGMDVAIGANVDDYYIEHSNGLVEASRWISQRTIWKDVDETALEQLNQNADIAFTDLDLTAFTSALAKSAIIQIVIRPDAVTGDAGGWLYVGVRKNGTAPANYPQMQIVKPMAVVGQTYRSQPIIVGCDSDQIVEWALQMNPDDASWQVDFWIYVLGYME